MPYPVATSQAKWANTYSATAPGDDETWVEDLDVLDRPPTGILLDYATEAETQVLDLDVELDVEKVRQLIDGFGDTRRELDADPEF